MRLRNIFYILCLLMAGTGSLSANPPENAGADSYRMKSSISAELLSKDRQPDGKITFKCRVTRHNDRYIMLAKILRNDSSLHVRRQGVTFELTDGGTVVLTPERDSACCSNWADGRWFNTSFMLDGSDVERLSDSKIKSVTITCHEGVICRTAATGKEGLLAELLRSVMKD